MSKLLSLKKPPDAIISFNDYVHLDAVQYALQNGIKVNEDIFFASYANISTNKYAAFPPLVSIDQFPYQQGQAAMNMLIDILQKKQAGVDIEKEMNEPIEIQGDLAFSWKS